MAQINRPLSSVERWYWLCDQFSTLNVISRVRVRGNLQRKALRHGLDMLQARHPFLRARIEHDNGLDPRWSPRHEQIPLREARRDREDQWIHEINEHELVHRIDTDTGPLIRTVAIIGADGIHDLLVVVPHIIADGTTVMSLAEQWLTLSALSDSYQSRARVLPPPEDLRPPKFTGVEGAARLAEQTALDEELIGWCRPDRVEPTVRIPLEERRTRLLHRELDRNQIAATIRSSREHETTVHGALTAALVRAAARDANRRATHFAVGSPIDFRSELVPPVQPDEVGSYVATVASFVDITQPFWDLARAITQDLKARKLRGDHFNLMTLVVGAAPKSMADARPFMEFMEAEGPINLCSSNIGRYDFPDRIGDWHLSDAQFLTGISVNGYFVATINSSHDRLFWNFTYIDRAVPADRAERLADDCVRDLLSALSRSVHPACEEQ